MNSLRLAGPIDWSRCRLTRFRVIAACALLLATSLGVAFFQYSNAKDYVLPAGTTLGGDYVAFYAAAKEAAAGRIEGLYDAESFEARLKEHGPPRERYGLTWQYPPTYLFVILPLAAMGFAPGYVFWTGAGAAGFFASLRSAGFKGVFLFVILAAPSTFHAAITGQNGFLTAALLILAAFHAEKRPIIAGLAAALLTVKPQLGVLLPIAFLAGGCWRAFLVAAIGTLALGAASLAVFGADAWSAFLDGARAASGNLAGARFPLYKMATPFAAARLIGLNESASLAFQIVCTLTAAGAVALVWRRVREADLRAAILCASVFLAAPYGYYYEFVILALPVAVLARRGLETGWLRYEQIILPVIFALPLFLPGEAKESGLPYWFFLMLMVWGSVLRRIAHDAPGALNVRRMRDRPLSPIIPAKAGIKR